jgi:hypothetical protein
VVHAIPMAPGFGLSHYEGLETQVGPFPCVVGKGLEAD